jgi:hypothetical protein
LINLYFVIRHVFETQKRFMLFYVQYNSFLFPERENICLWDTLLMCVCVCVCLCVFVCVCVLSSHPQKINFDSFFKEMLIKMLNEETRALSIFKPLCRVAFPTNERSLLQYFVVCWLQHIKRQ